MASASSLLCDEDQLLCSICLEVFNQPVTLNCGHNFCKACVTQHCHGNSQYQCPMCKELFNTGSETRVNTLLSGLADQFRKSLATKDSVHPEQQCAEPAVLCDCCTGTKNKAVKSCLVCVASYCETHLEPHQRITGLKVHHLINPAETLEDRICIKHSRPLEMFCKTDEVCVCQFCCELDHKLHVVVPLKEGYEGKKAEMEQIEAEVQQMIQERRLKILQIQRSVKLSKDDADREIADGVKVFTALRDSIDRSQAELISSVQDKQKSSEREAEGFIKELEQEIMGLTKRSSELEKLSHNEDLLHLLLTLSAPPPNRDLKRLNVCCPSHVGTVRRSLDQLEKTLSMEMKKLCVQAELERVEKDAVDVTLDGQTAHPKLVLSDDGKSVHYGDIIYNLMAYIYYAAHLIINPGRFSYNVSVLGKQSFSSGRFYFEVDVKGKTRWRVGIARESCNRKGDVIFCPMNGFCILRLIENEYKACIGPDVILSVKEKIQKVGVFVDYVEGLVSFYDVENRVHIYSFTGCTFTEPLYPLLNPGDNHDGKNSAPLIITPVNSTE